MVPFLSILVVEFGTMKCFYCRQKHESVVPWDSLSPDDRTFRQQQFSHQIDYCRTALFADHSCTRTQHTVRCNWDVSVHSSSSGRLCLCPPPPPVGTVLIPYFGAAITKEGGGVCMEHPIFFSKPSDKKCKEKNGQGFEPTVANCKTTVFTTLPLPCTVFVMHRDHVQTEGRHLYCLRQGTLNRGEGRPF